MLLAAASPAIVRASSLMKWTPTASGVLTLGWDLGGPDTTGILVCDPRAVKVYSAALFAAAFARARDDYLANVLSGDVVRLPRERLP